MGSSGSKAAQNTARKFPSRAPGSVPPPSAAARTARLSPASRSQPQASAENAQVTQTDSAADSSGFDSVTPDFAKRLKQMGIAKPNPIFSPSSTAADAFPTAESFSNPQFAPSRNNATLGVLEARRRIQEQADRELENTGRPGGQGKEFLEVGIVKKILTMRERGDPAADIEATLKLKPGVVARLGPRGIVAPA